MGGGRGREAVWMIRLLCCVRVVRGVWRRVTSGQAQDVGVSG